MLYGDMKESVEFATENTISLKDVKRKDFRLMLQCYYSCHSKPQSLKEFVNLALMGDFFDIKDIREDTTSRIQNYICSFPRHPLRFFTDDSLENIYELVRVLSELNLVSALEGCLYTLKLPHLAIAQDKYLLVDDASYDCLFKQYALYYTILKKHFSKELGVFHQTEVVPLIQIFVMKHLIVRLSKLISVIISEPFEKTIEMKERTDLGGFVIMKESIYKFDLDFSDFPVKMPILKLLTNLPIRELTLQKGNFSMWTMRDVVKLFPGVVVTLK
jgi:hypothetical protein